MVLGKEMIIRGFVHSEEDVVLNGEMEGDLNIENYRLTIGPHGRVAANVRAREVYISGALTGDVTTRGIVIEEGALFKGKVEIIADTEVAREVKSGE